MQPCTAPRAGLSPRPSPRPAAQTAHGIAMGRPRAPPIQQGQRQAGPLANRPQPAAAQPMDCLSARSTVKDVVLKFPIQFGKTMVAVNALGYTMDHNPGPVMVTLPGEVSMHKWVAQKLNPMIEETPAVRTTLTSTDSRNGSKPARIQGFCRRPALHRARRRPLAPQIHHRAHADCG